jgi:hypothetical protein
LLKAAFTARELRRFCQDRPAFRSLLDRFGVDLRLEDMADDVIEYCQKRGLFSDLLGAIWEFNPVQYERYFPRIHATVDGAEAPLHSAPLASRIDAFAQNLRARAQTRDDDVSSPYRGLLEYRLSDAALFFGRKRAIDELCALLERSSLTVLHSESGAGKTSLLKAGVSPRLLADGALPVHVRSYNISPALSFKRVFFPGLHPRSALGTAPLRDFLHQASPALRPGAKFYIILDQFEEFFIHLDEVQRANFVDELTTCLEDSSLGVRWILSLRSEFFANLASFRPRICNPFENDYYLKRLTRSEALEVVTEPIARHGISFDPDLVEKLLDHLGQDAIAPPQLQLVCQALYEELSPGEVSITAELYARLGGAAGILQQHLERVINRDLPGDQRAPARHLIEALVTSDGRRVLRTRAELIAESAPLGITSETLDAILSQLWDSRLVHLCERDADGTVLAYELVHDYLLDEIELSPEVQARKAAQELLAREVLNWQLFGALMHPRTLKVVGVQRNLLNIDETARELLLRSAFETDVNLAGWLAFVSPSLARQTLLDGLKRTEPELRARAARHLGDFADADAESRLFQYALDDGEQAVREAAFETLAQVASDKARQALTEDLEHPQAERRVQAALAARSYLDEEMADKLYSRVRQDGDESAWVAALETLADDEAAPYRANWLPLLKAGVWRKAAAYQKLKSWHADLPRSFRWRLVPARTASYFRHEAQTRPVWLAARVLLVIALYLGLAWLQGWPPFLRWERVAGSPQESLLTIDTVGDRLYVGSYDHGLAWRNAERDWSGWLREGLPTGTLGNLTDPESNARAIDVLVVDETDSERIYALVEENGLHSSRDGGETWTRLGIGQVPTITLSLDVQGASTLVVASREGLYGSDDGGQTWRMLSGENGLPAGEYLTVRFDPSDHPYTGSTEGLYRGKGSFPWTWEKVLGDYPVSHLDFGTDRHLYLALGWPGITHVACYTPDSGLGPLTDFGGGILVDNIITTLVAHPDEAELFYVGTIKQVYELRCDGGKRGLGQVRGGSGVADLALIRNADGELVLVQTNLAGLYQRVP